jgi:hypothetical protein
VAVLQRLINVNTGTGPLYTVVVNDPGQEFTSFQFSITSEDVGNGNLTSAAVDAAVHAFADSLVASAPTFVLGSITKTTVADAPL